MEGRLVEARHAARVRLFHRADKSFSPTYTRATRAFAMEYTRQRAFIRRISGSQKVTIPRQSRVLSSWPGDCVTEALVEVLGLIRHDTSRGSMPG